MCKIQDFAPKLSSWSMNNPPSSSSGVASSSFDDYNTKIQTYALKATRSAATLPADINFYRSIDTGLAHDVDAISSRVLNLTNKLLGFSSSLDTHAVKGKGKARLEDQDDVVDNFHSLVVDVMDQLFERTVGFSYHSAYESIIEKT